MEQGLLPHKPVFFLLYSPKGSRCFANYSKERPEKRRDFSSAHMSFLFPNKSFLTCYLVVSPSAYTFYLMLSASGVSWGTVHRLGLRY